MASEEMVDAVDQEQQQSWSGEEGWNGVSTEDQNTSTEHSEQEPNLSLDPEMNTSPGETAEDNEEDGGEYDPESITFPAASTLPPLDSAHATPASESTPAVESRPNKKAKTAGGFLVGSSDDEDEDSNPEESNPEPQQPTNQNEPSAAPTEPQPTEPQAPTHIAAQASPEQEEFAYAPPPASMPPVPAVDNIGLLEDRVREDPRGDLDAWLELFAEQRARNRIEDIRDVYERFLAVFPHAADIWVEYLELELSLDNFPQVETIFQRSLLAVPSVPLYSAYLNYIRRRNDLNDPSGKTRQTVTTAYDFVLGRIGQDRDAGKIWQDYIQFIKSGPGRIDGNDWVDGRKKDQMRSAYQRAICVPMTNLNALWKEYDQFELGLNKMAGRKFLQERSPSYMTARSANTHLENITRGLQRSTLARLPPAPGFAGDQEFQEQVALWKAWIAWEKDDPLVLQDDDPATYRQRILLVYRQALMSLRFWPELWVEAAEWCFDNAVVEDQNKDTGLQFLTDGVAANPESPLLALKHADRIESTHPAGEGDAGKDALVQAVRAPYDVTFNTLYDMVKKLKDREAAAVKSIQEDPNIPDEAVQRPKPDDDDEGEVDDTLAMSMTREVRIKGVQAGFAGQIQILSQHISHLWIALARACRRIQGQGKSKPPSGIRGVFTEARGRGRCLSSVYVAIAQMEWDIYQDPVATKIFERGARLFPEDEHFTVEYLKHLHARHDTTNARVVFSQTAQRFKTNAQTKPEAIHKLKPLYAYFHSYEAKFGELAQIKDLEKQMKENFPEDSGLASFAARFSTPLFDPVTARIVVSPIAQMRPKAIMQSVEMVPASVRGSPQPGGSPRPPVVQVTTTNSPKRPFPADDAEEFNPPRKMARGVSPLKGAAGRRLDQQRRAAAAGGSGPSSGFSGGSSSTPAAPAISRDITFLLSQIPPRHHYDSYQLKPDGVVRLMAKTHIPDFKEWEATQQGRGAMRAHTRNASVEYPTQPMASSRDSPAPGGGRPASPYGGGIGVRPSQPPAGYRNSPLRPGSSGSYEPPPAAGYGQFAGAAAAAGASWQGYPGAGYGQPNGGQYGGWQ